MIEYKSGASYKGKLNDGLPSGQGVMTCNGSRYEGAFKNGMRHGQGYVYNDQGCTSSNWSEDKLVEEPVVRVKTY